MIIKHNETHKLNLIDNKFILFHGKNHGLKNEKISELILKSKGSKILKYDEREIIENKEIFFDNVLNGSLFENKKLIIINRPSEKILSIIEILFNKKILDLIFIINANILEKKSKLRTFFEKDKNAISIAFYPDTNETLTKLTQNFFSKLKIPISYENINILVNKCGQDRHYLNNELKKVELFLTHKKKLETSDLIKLVNLTENFSVNELIDTCLSKNKKKTINILNENNFVPEDCILIVRTFINKSKRLLNLLHEYNISKNLNETLSNARPPIFWKEKDIVKLQIKNWTPENVRDLIYSLSILENQIKKGILNPLHLLSDFILDKTFLKTNN